MENPASAAARRRTLEIPAKPEAGLAEWTSKIKAIQRQVDADEEQEQRRLEEEIAASRRARMRRSLTASAPSTPSPPPPAPAPDREPEPAAPPERREGQQDALRRLMGERRGATLQLHAGAPPASGDAMSLAAFIGGRAAGPRLTRQAPQPDAHDPTLFEQRTCGPAVHPVFGRGGVAMPGMVKGRREPEPERPERSALAASNERAERDRRVGEPSASAVRAYVERAEKQGGRPGMAGAPGYRQRTISTPSGSAAAAFSPTTPARSQVEPGVSRPTSSTSATRALAPTAQLATPSARPVAPYERPKSAASRTASPITSPVAHSFHPTQSAPSISVVPSSSPKPTATSPKPSISTPSLARPIHPSPRASLGPQIPSHNPSPAFLRTPPSKDPTPSISRLQGRGFVKSMVQATSQISEGTAPSTPSPPSMERRLSGERKASVLDRWQHSPSASSPPPPIISPRPVHKAVTADHSPPPSRSLKSMASMPAMSASRAKAASDVGGEGSENKPIRLPGLGSSKTKVAYIEPGKTGEAAWPPPEREADELGVRVRGPPSGKPLSHLTKDRARKPRKPRPGDAAKGTSAQGADGGEHAAQEPPLLSAASASTTIEIPQRTSPAAEDVSVSPVPPSPTPEKPLLAPKPALGRKPAPFIDTAVTSPSENVASPLLSPPARSPKPKERTPPSPRPRIPSTGKRATVMDVAQTFQQYERREPSPAPASPAAAPSTSTPAAQAAGAPEDTEEEVPRPDVKSLVAGWGPQNGALQAPKPLERRRSSYDKHPSLPPLQEEKTPIPSPAGTLSRTGGVPSTVQEESVVVEEKFVSAIVTPSVAAAKAAPEAMATAPVDELQATQVVASDTSLVQIDHSDEPLPVVDVDALLNSPEPSSDVQGQNPISVDVMSVIGNTTTPITRDTHILYDNELLAIVYRAKARSTGLVSTKVWAWRGKKSIVGDREERKLQELARRYGTPLITVHEFCEPPELVSVLGGTLITRQGTRTHWSAENTAMHVVRSIKGVTHIDELDFGVRNLCSGFSFCLSLLDTLYVWHGCGSTEAERHAALEYGKSLSSQSSTLIELIEAVSDNDEMFWMILGEGEYAKADYWKWRPAAGPVCPRRWVVDLQNSNSPVRPVASFTDDIIAHESVFIIDCIWELFVLVGMEARGRRREIQLALSVAKTMSTKTASSKPFSPTLHVLVLPTRIPADLRLSLRELDENELNCGIIPDHMNLAPATEAQMQLDRTIWESGALQDTTILPVGVHSSNML